jgi:hypothetical protein
MILRVLGGGALIGTGAALVFFGVMVCVAAWRER